MTLSAEVQCAWCHDWYPAEYVTGFDDTHMPVCDECIAKYQAACDTTVDMEDYPL